MENKGSNKIKISQFAKTKRRRKILKMLNSRNVQKINSRNARENLLPQGNRSVLHKDKNSVTACICLSVLGDLREKIFKRA